MLFCVIHKFEMAIFKFVQVMTENVSFAFHLGESALVFRGLRCDFKFVSFFFFDEIAQSKQTEYPHMGHSFLPMHMLFA